MMLTVANIDETYFDLVRAFPLHRIRDDADLDNAIAMVDTLLDRGNLSAGEEEYFDALGQLIEAYESVHVQIPDVRGIDVLRHMMEEHSLDISNMAAVFGTESAARAVLNGTRDMTLREAQ